MPTSVQISLAAAGAIRGRLHALCGGALPTPEQLLALDEATLRGVGLSRAKTRYLRELATRSSMGGSISPDCAPSTMTRPAWN